MVRRCAAEKGGEGGEGAVAHFRKILADGRERRRRPLRNGVVVKTDEAHVARHGEAVLRKGSHGDSRDGVAAADEARYFMYSVFEVVVLKKELSDMNTPDPGKSDSKKDA